MSAAARNLSEELFKLVDKDNSGKISEAEFADACGTIAVVSPVVEGISHQYRTVPLDGNRDGEVDRPEWSRRVGAVVKLRGSEIFVDECFRSLRAVRDANVDGSQREQRKQQQQQQLEEQQQQQLELELQHQEQQRGSIFLLRPDDASRERPWPPTSYRSFPAATTLPP